jgi:hypothetical protein
MDLATRDVDLAFADMICHDPQWLAAEFDELVSANFSEPPVPRPPAPPRVPPCPGTPPPSSRGPRPVPAAVTVPAPGPGHGRQRSPPAHPSARPPDGRLSDQLPGAYRAWTVIKHRE